VTLGNAIKARRKGQVLLIALVAMTLLAGLVFYVYNVGNVVNRRLQTQTAADSAAISGATWMARSMNLVAMNNVAVARLIALDPILDSLPLAAEMAHVDADALTDSASGQINDSNNRDIPNEYHEQVLFRSAMAKLLTRLKEQRDIVADLDAALNQSNFHVEDVTFWTLPDVQGNGPHGSLWQACMALDDFSQATAVSAGTLAQANADAFARANGAEAALLLPISPILPAVEGSFLDFQKVLQWQVRVEYNDETGAIRGFIQKVGSGSEGGGAIPDFVFPYRVGPWARLLKPFTIIPWSRGWRDPIWQVTDWRILPADPTAGKVRGGPNIFLNGHGIGDNALTGSPATRRPSEYKCVGYLSYGPYQWALRMLGGWPGSGLAGTAGSGSLGLNDLPFLQHLQSLSDIKFEYLFDVRPVSLRSTRYPQWTLEYPQAVRYAQANPDKVAHTVYFQFRIVSSAVPMGPKWLTPGTYRTNEDSMLSFWADGWQDIGAMNNCVRVGKYVWRNEWGYETTQDSSIGIQLRKDAQGNEEYQSVYVTDWYVFVGIDAGDKEVSVRNPANWTAGERLPAPMLLDTSLGDYTPDADSGVRRSFFTFLGAAGRSDAAPVWPQRFSSANPGGKMYAIAQASVFNNTSWDLWTQDWQAQLCTVTQWEDWTNQLEKSVADASPKPPTVDSEKLREIWEYLSRLNPDLVEKYVNH
jgi:hypothetical protein